MGQRGRGRREGEAVYVIISLVPRPLPDFILQLWRNPNFSPQLGDKMWEWPGNEAM